MVKHIVLFRLEPSMDEGLKSQVMQEFKEKIEALPAQIPFIRKVEVGLNMNPAEAYDLALYSEFDTLADVQAYAVHPAHVAAAGVIKDYKVARSCTDYEL
ncbi:MAG: Dabb family protein [Paraprevotella sp.]|jgi:stress responsive A/B barrel domain protein|nr:Dabb family protein [Paraprevotella sp.]MBP3472085.1 Dabb family protein [Paraprevotella sp.]